MRCLSNLTYWSRRAVEFDTGMNTSIKIHIANIARFIESCLHPWMTIVKLRGTTSWLLSQGPGELERPRWFLVGASCAVLFMQLEVL